jgi:hypothetical protein
MSKSSAFSATRAVRYGVRATIRPLFADRSVACLHTGRCGSTVLGALLEQHPDVVWVGEVFEPYRPYALRAAGRERPRGYDPARILRRGMRHAGPRWYGFELKMGGVQLRDTMGRDIAGALDLVASLGVHRLVVLERRNHLRAIVSAALGQSSGTFHRAAGSPAGGSPAAHPRIALDLDRPLNGQLDRSLLDVIDARTRAYEAVRSWTGTHECEVLELAYEDHIQDDPLNAYHRVTAFVGLRDHAPVIRHGRTTPYPLADVLINWSEVADTVGPTPYAWMLHE